MSTPVGYDVYAGADYNYLGRVKRISDVNLLLALYGTVGFKVGGNDMRKIGRGIARATRRPALIHKGGKP